MPPLPSVFTGGPGGNPNPAVTPNMRTDELYGGDPVAAMMAVLQNMGVNPFRSNPFVQRILQSAPGLQSAWQLSNIGAKGDDIEGMGGVGQMFNQFLQGQLSNGSIFSTLANARQNMGNYANQMNQLYGQVGTQDMSNLAPFLGQLDEQLNDPSGFARLYSSLAAPGLGPLGQSMDRAIKNNVYGAARNRLLPPEQGGQQDLLTGPTFFDYIMGRRPTVR